jgi:hypothetical protein
MADNKHNNKNVQNTTSDEDFLTQKYKWEQGKFVEALENKDYETALAIMETTLNSAEAKRKWWDRPEAKEHLFSYMRWLRDCRQQAGNKDWRMWQTVLDEMRFMLNIDRMDQKIDITSAGEKLDPIMVIDLGNINATDKHEAESDSTDDKG